HGVGLADIDLGIDIHVVKQLQVGVLQFGAEARGPRLPVDLGIDDLYFPDEFAPRITPRLHHDALTERYLAEIAFGDVDERPDHRMVGYPEQDAALLRAHSLDCVPLQNDAVARDGPLNGGGDVL